MAEPVDVVADLLHGASRRCGRWEAEVRFAESPPVLGGDAERVEWWAIAQGRLGERAVLRGSQRLEVPSRMGGWLSPQPSECPIRFPDQADAIADPARLMTGGAL